MQLNIFYFLTALLLGFVAGRFQIAPNERKIQAKLETQASFLDLPALSGKTSSFAQLICETLQLKIIPFDHTLESHRALKKIISQAAEECRSELSAPHSPLRELRRINEASRYFEDLLCQKIDAHPDFSCGTPLTRQGKAQHSGYPDLRIKHLPSGTVAYLDPKLYAEKSQRSTFRSFYYEPNDTGGKITENALHFLLGFPHDSQTQAWTFGEARLLDLSNLQVTLKAEFFASNKDLYADDLNLNKPL